MPNGNRRHQDDADELEAAEDMADRRHGIGEAEARQGAFQPLDREAAVVEAEQGRSPGDDGADDDGHQPARHALEVANAAEPIDHDDGKADQADDRRHHHLRAGTHRDEGDRDAGQRTQQCRARRDLADVGRNEAAAHQHEALHEHPGEARLPGLHRILGGDQDRQHDHEHHDEHVRHADAGRQGADVGAAGLLGQAIGEPGIVHRAQAQHQAGGGEDAAEHQLVRHLEHEAQQAGEHQHVDQDVGAEAEERIPVAWNPKLGLEVRGRDGHVALLLAHCRLRRRAQPPPIAATISAELPTQPKMPPCALIIFRPMSWNSGK